MCTLKSVRNLRHLLAICTNEKMGIKSLLSRGELLGALNSGDWKHGSVYAATRSPTVAITRYGGTKSRGVQKVEIDVCVKNSVAELENLVHSMGIALPRKCVIHTGQSSTAAVHWVIKGMNARKSSAQCRNKLCSCVGGERRVEPLAPVRARWEYKLREHSTIKTTEQKLKELSCAPKPGASSRLHEHSSSRCPAKATVAIGGSNKLAQKTAWWQIFPQSAGTPRRCVQGCEPERYNNTIWNNINSKLKKTVHQTEITTATILTWHLFTAARKCPRKPETFRGFHRPNDAFKRQEEISVYLYTLTSKCQVLDTI